jgi:hypothetical protein
MVGSLATHMAAGATRTLTVPLNAVGRRLLRKRHAIIVKLTVTGTVIGTLTARLRSDELIIRMRTHWRRHTRWWNW